MNWYGLWHWVNPTLQASQVRVSVPKLDHGTQKELDMLGDLEIWIKRGFPRIIWMSLSAKSPKFHAQLSFVLWTCLRMSKLSPYPLWFTQKIKYMITIFFFNDRIYIYTVTIANDPNLSSFVAHFALRPIFSWSPRRCMVDRGLRRISRATCRCGVLEVTIQQNQKAYETGIYIDLWIFLWWIYVAFYLQLGFETNHWGVLFVGNDVMTMLDPRLPQHIPCHCRSGPRRFVQVDAFLFEPWCRSRDGIAPQQASVLSWCSYLTISIVQKRDPKLGIQW